MEKSDNLRKEIGSRLREVRTVFNLRQNIFAQKLDIEQRNLSKYENGSVGISDDIKNKLYYNFGISMDWFISGEGVMYNKYYTQHNKQEHYFNEHGVLIENDDAHSTISSIVLLSQRVAAGIGQGATQLLHEQDGNIPVLTQFIAPYSAHEVRAIKASGDSMIDIQLCNSDIVFFVPNLRSGDGLYIIRYFGEYRVKRISYKPYEKLIVISSENKAYKDETIPISVEETGDLVIEGKVIGWIHKHLY